MTSKKSSKKESKKNSTDDMGNSKPTKSIRKYVKKSIKISKPKSTKKSKKSVKLSREVEPVEMVFELQPHICVVEKAEKSIFDSKGELIVVSENIDYPRFCYGFQHFLHANKNYMVKIDKFEGKKKVYLVINPFETIIFDYDKSIETEMKKYFGIDYLIPSLDLFKMWEIINEFDIVGTKEGFESAHIYDGVGGAVQAIQLYRDKFSKKSKSDKYYVVSGVGNYKIDKKYTDSRVLVDKKIPNKVDLIVGGASFDYEDKTIKEDVVREQQLFGLLISQILFCVRNLRKGGNFICRFYETYTQTSLKIITMLNEMFGRMSFVKPMVSRPMISEKYAVCEGYLLDGVSKQSKHVLECLEKIEKAIQKNNKLNLIDLFEGYEMEKKFINSIIVSNTDIANKQLEAINKVSSFIDGEIYSGEVFQSNREKQIKGSEYWLKLFRDGGGVDGLVKYVVSINTQKITALNSVMVEVN
jgi:hypothetical protein